MLLRIEMNESLLHDGDEVLSAESDADLLIEFGKSSVSAQGKLEHASLHCFRQSPSYGQENYEVRLGGEYPSVPKFGVRCSHRRHLNLRRA